MAPDKQIRIGDRIALSVRLIQDIHELPQHRSLIVVVVDVETEPDGSKVLIVRKEPD